MDDHIFGSWNRPRPRYQYAAPPAAQPKMPKVVSIPVNFIGSDEKKPSASSVATRQAAALKIQKCVRGFLVRKNLGVLRRVEAEVDEIEKRMEEEEETVRKDEKQRLRLNEMLMAVLFRLDSVRGVREYRKKVIRRAISLQEALDSMAEKVIEVVGDRDQEAGGEEMAGDQPCGDLAAVTLESKSNGTLTSATGAGGEKSFEAIECAKEEELTAAVEESVGNHPHSAGEAGVDTVTAGKREESSAEGEGELEEEEEESGNAECKKKKKMRMEEMMERMVEENEKLKGLVAELCERNLVQCRLMSGLSQRVEQLEKSVERMARKKKRKQQQQPTHLKSSFDKNNCCGRK